MANGSPTVNLQGVEVPATSVDAKTFYANTRRKRFNEKSISTFAGLGSADQFTIKQSGIIAALDIHVSASVVITTATGAVASTPRWPYDFLSRVVVSANGTTNIISCSGAKLAAYRFTANPNLNDRGVKQGIGGASPGTAVTQGTLSLASESWGVGSNVTAIPAGTYDVELYFRLPLAFDEVKLLGAVFGQTQATSLNVELDYATLASLFTITGTSTVTFASCAIVCEGVVFSIPYGPDGNIVVPNLAAYHKFIQANDYGVGAGLYGSTLVGQGVGQLLQRVFFQLWNGSTSAPVPITSTNYGQIGWQYGGDQFPEAYGANAPAGGGAAHMLRFWQEQLYSTDLGALGFGCLDFASQWLLRDAVDESTATNLQLMVTPNVSITSPRLEVVQETLSAGTGMYGSSGN
jgi:hypothetical protein